MNEFDDILNNFEDWFSDFSYRSKITTKTNGELIISYSAYVLAKGFIIQNESDSTKSITTMREGSFSYNLYTYSNTILLPEDEILFAGQKYIVREKRKYNNLANFNNYIINII